VIATVIIPKSKSDVRKDRVISNNPYD